MLLRTCTSLYDNTMTTYTYTSLRENLADALELAEKGETIEITRRGHKSVFLTSALKIESEVEAKTLGDLLEPKSVKFASKEKFNASLKRIQKKHAKNIKALADR